MNHWAFVSAAYAVALGGTVLLLLSSWFSMGQAESAADAVKRR